MAYFSGHWSALEGWVASDSEKRQRWVVAFGLLAAFVVAALLGTGINRGLQCLIEHEIDQQIEASGTEWASNETVRTVLTPLLSEDVRYRTLRPLERDWSGFSWPIGGKHASPYRVLTAKLVFLTVYKAAPDGTVPPERQAEFKQVERVLAPLIDRCYESGPYVLFRMYSSCTYVHMQWVTLLLFCWGVVHTLLIRRGTARTWRLDSPRQEYPREIVLNYLLKVVPLTGFIGTVISMPEAIDKAHALVGAKDLHEPFKKVTSALAAKFDTTFLGLFATILLFLVVDFSGEGSDRGDGHGQGTLPTPPDTEPPETEPQTEAEPPPEAALPPETEAPENMTPENKPPENKPPENKPPENKPPENKPPETEATDAPENKPPETKTKAPENKPPENKPPETDGKGAGGARVQVSGAAGKELETKAPEKMPPENKPLETKTKAPENKPPENKPPENKPPENKPIENKPHLDTSCKGIGIWFVCTLLAAVVASSWFRESPTVGLAFLVLAAMIPVMHSPAPDGRGLLGLLVAGTATHLLFANLTWRELWSPPPHPEFVYYFVPWIGWYLGCRLPGGPFPLLARVGGSLLLVATFFLTLVLLRPVEPELSRAAHASVQLTVGWIILIVSTHVVPALLAPTRPTTSGATQ